MPDFTVIRVGTDTSGRGIFLTRHLWEVWQAVLAHPSIKPFAHKIVIVQGAFMTRNGGGAAASAGFHDQAGCVDIRTWNLTTSEINVLIWVLRSEAGIAAWRRDRTWLHGGMDPHIHFTAGWDRPLSAGAADSWRQYLNNQNGLASRRVDYERRPSPLVTTPKPSLFTEEDTMSAEDVKAIRGDIADLRERVNEIAENERGRDTKDRERYWAEVNRAKQRHSETIARFGGVVDAMVELTGKVDDAATRAEVQAIIDRALDSLSEDPAVDGPDNPATEPDEPVVVEPEPEPVEPDPDPEPVEPEPEEPAVVEGPCGPDAPNQRTEV